MKKKAAIAVLAVVVTITQLAACGSTNSKGTEKNQGAATTIMLSTEANSLQANASAAGSPAMESETEVNDTTIASESSQNNTFISTSDIMIMGDSVAKGYATYGKVPVDNDVSEESASVNSCDEQINSLKKNAKVVVVSLGVNDWGSSYDSFVEKYGALISKVRQHCPTSVILTSAITPIAKVSDYGHVKPERLKNLNSAIKDVSEKLDDKVLFFDAFSVLSKDGEHLDDNYAASDGLHLQPGAYDLLLEAMGRTISGSRVRM
ncbi:MAG: hypothetical protein IKH90_07825 [Ruminococcus sp.]|nr:hypothetical protein [Ruminococcus sp.]